MRTSTGFAEDGISDEAGVAIAIATQKEKLSDLKGRKKEGFGKTEGSSYILQQFVYVFRV